MIKRDSFDSSLPGGNNPVIRDLEFKKSSAPAGICNVKMRKQESDHR
jgi:hypothetical protein